MKIIKITESQYKRLVKLNNIINENIVYPSTGYKSLYGASMLLSLLSSLLKNKHNKDLYIKKIEDGKIYIDEEYYEEKEKSDISVWVYDLIKDSQSIEDEWVYDGFYIDTGKVDVDFISNEKPEIYSDDEIVDNNDLNYDKNKTYSRTEYINLVKNIAINQMKKHKIPASITIAQAVLESGNGNSVLSREGKNHFGVKCHGWTGDKSYHDDDRPDECFRNYDKIEDSFEDHSKFLKNNSRYNSLFDLDIKDYKGWANGLKKAGYATSPSYATKLINIIEKNNLQQYDKQYSNVGTPTLGGGSSDIDMSLETPKSTGNYFRKGNNKLYGKKGHSGHDYVAVNNPIVYMKKGKVKYASFDNNSCGGTITIVPDGEDRKAIFCHMSEIYVSTGEPIKSGTIIGVSGGGKGQKGAGHSTGHHLHFGMKNRSDGGKFIDPNDYIDDIKIIRD
jgi:murein DD-endopeptidase MepM/ murein hydrolase activator NlpD